MAAAIRATSSSLLGLSLSSTSAACVSIRAGTGAFAPRRMGSLRLGTPPQRVALVVTARRAGGGPKRRPSGGGKKRPPGGPRKRRPDRAQEEENNDVITSDRRFKEVRLVGENVEAEGECETTAALAQAKALGLDLVKISDGEGGMPICRLLDYKKFKYEQEKKAKFQKKKTSALRVGLKELKLSYNTDTADYDVRKKAAIKFLEKGDKVKFICQFKGREMQFKAMALELFEQLIEDLQDYGELDGVRPKIEGRQMLMIISPNVSKAQVKGQVLEAQERQKKKDKQAKYDAKNEARKEALAAKLASGEPEEEEKADEFSGDGMDLLLDLTNAKKSTKGGNTKSRWSESRQRGERSSSDATFDFFLQPAQGPKKSDRGGSIFTSPKGASSDRKSVLFSSPDIVDDYEDDEDDDNDGDKAENNSAQNLLDALTRKV